MRISYTRTLFATTTALLLLVFAPAIQAQVVINEIHYNPLAPTTQEFVELYNRGAAAVDVSGWSIPDGIVITLPPGTTIAGHGYLVLALDPNALQTATGYAGAIQWTAGTLLSNGGELLTLRDASTATVDPVNYDDAAPWPAGPGSPDGFGPSLELINPALDNNAGASWLSSTVTNGTPGAQNSVFSNAATVQSESPARRTAVVTLPSVSVTFSTSVTGVTAGSLTVGGSAATSLSCPTCSGGAGAGPYTFSGYAAPAAGSVSIAIAGAGILAGSIPFSGDSWTVSTGVIIVLNEIHYHPPDPDADAEFLEFYNAGNAPVVMTGWSFTSGITGTVPAGTTMQPGDYRVFAKNPALLQSLSGYSGSLAWGSGSLSNSGEMIAIADAAGNVIDAVTYGDSGQWPSPPDGDGPSLELVNPALPNQYGGAWKESLVTWGTPGAQNGVFLAAPPPIITAPLHSPLIPQPNQSVTITALVLDDSPVPPAVTLYHRQDFDPTIAYTSSPMFDDGLHGDDAAGDGRFGAIVAGLPDGERLDFTIRADDGTSVSAAPPGNDTLNAGEYPSQTFLVKFSSGPLTIDFPHYHLITTQHTRTLQEAHNENEYDATFLRCTPPANTCELFYNVVERYRGQSSLNQHPHSYRINFPGSQPFMSEMGFPLKKLNLHAQQPDRQALGYQFFREAFGGAIPSSRTAFIRLDTSPLSHGGIDDYAHISVEMADDDFAASQDGIITPLRYPNQCSASLTNCSTAANCPLGESCIERDTGNMYKAVLSADLQYLGPDPNSYRVAYEKETNETDEYWADLLNLAFVLDPDTTPAAGFEAAVNGIGDEDEWARFFAIQMLLVNQEGGIYRDTGDDYLLYFEPPTSPRGYNTHFLPRDLDSTFGGFGAFNQETIWRTTVQTTQRFIRDNAYAGRFVNAICQMMDNEFTQAAMDARIDALPDPIADANKRAQFKAWVAARRTFVQNEIRRAFTITGVPVSPYTSANPVISLAGELNQCGTYRITVNGQPATYSVYGATWSRSHTLTPGVNNILVQEWDHTGAELERIEQTVIYNPPGSLQESLRLEMPRRMFNDKTITLRAEVLDPIDRIASSRCDDVGSVSATRVSDGSPVPITVTVLDSHTTAGADSIRFYNGMGSISFTLDGGAAVPAGDIRVAVTLGSISASKIVTVEASPTFRALSGALSGANLTWGPDENIHITGNVQVPSGSTLVINPGTLVMVDTTGSLDNGTLITVDGNIIATGSEDRPIHFFSTAGPAAMTLTQSGGASNPNCWRGIHHFGGGTSTYRHIFLTGAGNGVVVSHPRPPIMAFNSNHSFLLEDSTVADNDGMGIAGAGTGSYTVRRSLMTRNGIGAEFNGNGHTLLIEDSWWTATGWAPEPANLDGDLIHVDGPASTQTIRRSIFADGGDDGIDHNGSTFTADTIIIRDILDKAISMTGGGLNITNSLIFDSGSGIRGSANVTNTTIAVGSPVATVLSMNRSIIWPSSVPTCPGSNVNYSIVGSAGDLGCGTGNQSVNPQFTATGSCNYNPAPGSPANAFGPSGERIGWLGFPVGEACVVNADCDDTNPCSLDTCSSGACSYAPIANCVPCANDSDCNDGNACTDDTCNTGSGTCVFVADNTNSCSDGVACTNDSCQAGVCAGTDACPGGATCNTGSGLCVAGPVTTTFQDGLGTYAGTQDTYLAQSAPTTPEGALNNWRWDTENPAPNQEYGLIRFDGIVGNGAGQIPSGSTISSATLTIEVTNGSVAPAGSINESTVDWSESTATWNNFGGDAGVQSDEFLPTPSFTAPIAAGSASIAVTASVQAWTNGTRSNFGWVFRPANNDGAQVNSAEFATVALRPKLTVTYVPPAGGCVINADCSDGQFCNGVEICVTGICQPGTAVNCSDSIACTADTCDETNDVCLHAPVPASCDDSNSCTTDTCVAGTGCVITNNTNACNDGNACTTGDVCGGGVCGGGAPLDCDDDAACTADSCNSLTGCVNTDTCTGGQTCNIGTGLCQSAAAQATFQDGVSGYTGTVDTFLHAGSPTANNSLVTPLIVDGPTVAAPGDERQILLRFDSMFVSQGGPIPDGATITSAILTVNIVNPSPDGAELHRMLIPWLDTGTWNSLVSGVQRDGVEAVAASDVTSAFNGTVPVAHDINVTSSVAAWSINPASNNGWVFVTPAGLNDSWQFDSSEIATVGLRPRLTVSYVPPGGGCVNNADCSDGIFCNGAETCVAGTCQAAAPGVCDDGVACSVDTCDELNDVCQHAACTVMVQPAGPRYLSVTPPAGLASVAIRVTSPGLSCLPKYVDAAGHLVASPVFRSSAQWATVFVGDREIAPSRQYNVTAEVVAGTPVGGGTATTWAWGDVDNQNGVNVFDILCVLDGSQGSFPHCTLYGVDLSGLAPNGVADANDISSVLDAFQSMPYPDPDPCGTPPPGFFGVTPENSSAKGGDNR